METGETGAQQAGGAPVMDTRVSGSAMMMHSQVVNDDIYPDGLGTRIPGADA